MKSYHLTRPWRADVNSRVENNPETMSNTMMRTRDLKGHDQCCGIHGAIRERRGAKKATSAARRRQGKRYIESVLEDGE